MNILNQSGIHIPSTGPTWYRGSLESNKILDTDLSCVFRYLYRRSIESALLNPLSTVVEVVTTGSSGCNVFLYLTLWVKLKITLNWLKSTSEHGRVQCCMVLVGLESLISSLSYLIAKNYSGYVFRETFSLSSGIPIGSGSISVRRSRFWTNKFLRLLLCFIFLQLYGVLFALFCESLDFLTFYANQKVSLDWIIQTYCNFYLILKILQDSFGVFWLSF